MSAQDYRKGYPVQLTTVGDHIRKVRMDRGLLQKQVAELVGASAGSIWGWEGNHAQPEVRYIPAIIRFLGYNPRPKPEGTLERLEWYKWTNGMSLERLGAATGCSWEQLADWLSGRKRLSQRNLQKICLFLDDHEETSSF